MARETPRRVLHIAAEFAGLAQTGGLADVIAAVSRETARRGYDVRVCLPLYGLLDVDSLELRPVLEAQEIVVPLAGGEYTFSVCIRGVAARNEAEAVVYLVDCPRAYARPTIYTEAADEHLRFALLARAALETCQRLEWAPEILHCHDWHAALVPLYRKSLYDWDDLLASSRSILTIHNLAYQGVFAASAAADLGLDPGDALDADDLRSNRLSFLKIGLRHADWLTTVSPTYAREILTAEQGMGLDGVLRSRADRLIGILNGIDDEVWDPSTDPFLPEPYSAADLSGKATCRRRLLADLGLEPDPSGPVLGIVSRLAEQKGFGLLPPVLPDLLAERDVRLVVLGTGERSLEHWFARLASDFSGKVAFRAVFDTALSHLIEAGSDIFLMPSRFEPCGLNQMYSLRYGTPPVVHRTGGLADTVEPFDPVAATGTGFVFGSFAPRAFRRALETALATFEQPAEWRRLVANGMSQDFSWSRRVDSYLELYRDLLRSD